jgi:hypothetical protein
VKSRVFVSKRNRDSIIKELRLQNNSRGHVKANPHCDILALWNAKGPTQHTEKLKTFISIHNTDVMLISEMHFTEKSNLKLPNYAVYHVNHPVGTARGGSDIIIKKYHQPSSTRQLKSRFPSSNQSVSGRLSQSLNNFIFHPNTQ